MTMNIYSSTRFRSWTENPAFVFSMAAIFYAVYYFVLCKLPIIGIPTFRIDYFATTVSRAHDDLARSILHARPISELYVYFQAIISRWFLKGQAKYLIYPLQHAALFIYFFSILKVIESIYEMRFRAITSLTAWLLFMTVPYVIGNVYLLETIVGTLSMLFGGLSLVFLAKWHAQKNVKWSALFFAFYTLSIFSKEDFILPPLFLLGWFLLKDGEWKSRVISHKWMLISLILLLSSFVVFNEFIIPGRSYMDPVEQLNAPYYMSLYPLSVLKVVFYYAFGIGLHIKIITLFYLTIVFASLAMRIKWKEHLLIVLIISGLMAPYAILPNHLFPYYGLNWWVWEILVSFALIQIMLPRHYFVAVALVGLSVLIPDLKGIYKHRNMSWYQSIYLRDNFSTSENLQKTLTSLRAKINSHKQIAVIGIGPGEIEQSPWQGNGETEFFLRDDLKLKPQWIVFVRSSNDSYSTESSASPASSLGSKVIVKNIKYLKDYKNLTRLVFNPNGVGTLMDSLSKSRPVESQVPSPLFAQGKDVLRHIAAADNYPYLRGFNQSEGVNGRWLSDDNLILLMPQAGDYFEVEAYAMPASAYRSKMAPQIVVSFNGCATRTQTMTPDVDAKYVFTIPDHCGDLAGKPVNVRIKISDLVDNSTMTDKRPLSVLGKEIGFYRLPH